MEFEIGIMYYISIQNSETELLLAIVDGGKIGLDHGKLFIRMCDFDYIYVEIDSYETKSLFKSRLKSDSYYTATENIHPIKNQAFKRHVNGEVGRRVISDYFKFKEVR